MHPPVTRRFHIRRSEICYATFILESYEGLCTASTIDRRGGLISITATAELSPQVDSLLQALAEETGMTEIAGETDGDAGGETPHA